MKSKQILLGMAGFLLSMMMLSGCQVFEKKNQAGAAVELNGRFIYRSTLDSLTLGLSSEDSIRVAQQYIAQWAQDILLYENAMSHTNPELEAIVANYRRTLYAQAYEERLVNRRMSKTILDSTVVKLFEQMPERFQLEESIMKGLLVVVHPEAPNLAKLRKWLNAPMDNIDNIEKYAYQNASGYELFTDKWLTTTHLLSRLPVERAELENKLKNSNHIEIADSTKLYILQITDKHMRGEAMPIEYARPEIEEIILNARQVEFLRKERERLYNEAIQDKKIIFF